MPSPFQKLDEKVEESRFAQYDRNMRVTREIFKQLKSNALGQPSGAWIGRKSGQEQPGIYAPPENEMVESASSGSWKAPLSKMMKYLSEEGGITLKEVMSEAKLSKYEAETLMDLVKHNKLGMTEK